MECVSGSRANPFIDQIVHNNAYVPLIRAVMHRVRVNQTMLHERTGISRSKLTRILGSDKSLDTPSLQTILLALEINMALAFQAVVRLKNWEAYFDPNVVVFSALNDLGPPELEIARSGQIEALLPGVVRALAKQVASGLAENDRQAEARREQCDIWKFQSA